MSGICAVPGPQVHSRRAGGVSAGGGGRASTRSPEDSVRQFTPRLPSPEAQASRLSQGRAVLPGATPRSARAIRHLPRPPPLLQSQASLDRSSSGRRSLPSRLNGQSLVLRRRALQWARDSAKARTGAKQTRILPLTRVHTHTTRACVRADYTRTAVHTHIEGHACLTGGRACTRTRDAHAHTHRGTCVHTHTGGHACSLTGGHTCSHRGTRMHTHTGDAHAHSHRNTRAHSYRGTRMLTHAHI